MFKSRLRRLKGRFLLDTGFFLPYYLFRVTVLNGGKTDTLFLAVDAMTGGLDLYGFEVVPREDEWEEVESNQFGEIALSEKQAFTRLREQLRRTIYQNGFFQVADLSITGELIRLGYFPYWVALYEQRGQGNVEVVDAVRGRFEGAKVQDLVLDWFRQESARRRLQAEATH